MDQRCTCKHLLHRSKTYICRAKHHHRCHPFKLSEGRCRHPSPAVVRHALHIVYSTGGNYNYLVCSGLRPLSLHHAAFLAVQAHDKAMCQQKDPRHSSVVLRLDKPCKYWPSEQCVCTRDFRIKFVHLSIWSKCPDSRIDRASSGMQLSPEVKAMKQRRHSERLMVCILSSISLFGDRKSCYAIKS
jgi:hypothetical protein